MRWLMNGVEKLLAIFDREGVVAAGSSWGTLLGAERHRNIIPWDYDGDFCLLEPDYQRVLDLFARRGGTIDGLTLRPDFFGEAGSCCAVVPPDAPNPEHALDLVAYRRDGSRLRHLMSDALVAQYPGRLRRPVRRRLSAASRLAPRPARVGAAPRGGAAPCVLRP